MGLMIAAAALVLMPFLLWQQTWFGRKLSETETGRYLADEKHPRRIQHALSQISDRIRDGDSQVRKWYPQVAALGQHPQGAIRVTSAWVMGQDNTSEMFHQKLLLLLHDREPMVRRNAALALIRFGDPAGREELRGMLVPYAVRAPTAGRVSILAEAGKESGTAALVARVARDTGEAVEVRSPFAGLVAGIHARDGSRVEAGDALVSISPGSEQVREALRGLYLIGEADDLPLIERYRHGEGEIPNVVKQQAELTAQAIRARTERSPIH
jgi:Biotin-lipoyl like